MAVLYGPTIGGVRIAAALSVCSCTRTQALQSGTRGTSLPLLFFTVFYSFKAFAASLRMQSFVKPKAESLFQRDASMFFERAVAKKKAKAKKKACTRMTAAQIFSGPFYLFVYF